LPAAPAAVPSAGFGKAERRQRQEQLSQPDRPDFIAVSVLQDAMPRPGLPLVHFNDERCDRPAELRSVILKARRLAHDHAERERAAVAVKTWLLARIEKKQAATPAAKVETEQDGSLPSPERLDEEELANR
jgi:hypothetical protein